MFLEILFGLVNCYLHQALSDGALMTSAFLPSHRAAPVTSASLLSEDASVKPGPVQGMVKVTKIESQIEVSDAAKQRAQTAIRVLVVDDHEIVRKGLCTMLSEQEDFEVVGQTGSGNLVVTLAMQLQPDIVLLDIFLGEFNGLDITHQFQRWGRKLRIVILTGYTEADQHFRAIRIGVHGYLQKALPINELLAALRAVQQD